MICLKAQRIFIQNLQSRIILTCTVIVKYYNFGLLNHCLLNKQSALSDEILYQFRLIGGISLGIFLFLLFFLPFGHKAMEFNDNLLFIIGLVSITFGIMAIFRILLPAWLNRVIKLETMKISNEVLIIVLIWVFNSLGSIFYLRYVGLLHISLFTGVKIVMFSSFPPVILKLADVNKNLREQLRHVVGRQIKMEKFEANEVMGNHPPLKFASESRTDKIEFPREDLMLVRSADNYVDIVYKEGDEVRRKTLRNTISNVQAYLRKYPEFLRCHRTCIINTHYILNLTNSYKGYRLRILDYDEEIPVSRQYILLIKEYMDND